MKNFVILSCGFGLAFLLSFVLLEEKKLAIQTQHQQLIKTIDSLQHKNDSIMWTLDSLDMIIYE